MRFNELQRELGTITQATLTKQLKQLEKDGLINRKVYAQIPPKSRIQFNRNWSKSFIMFLMNLKIGEMTI